MANYQSGGSFLPDGDINFTGQVNFTQTPTFGTGATGAVLVNPSITGATLNGTTTIATGATITNPAIAGATITGTVTIATGASLINPSITGAVVTGTVTVASGASITTPTILFTSQALTATGATGGAGTALSAVTPVLATLTGASGTAIDLVTGAAVAGAFYSLRNINATGVITVYAVGGTINGTTGTTGLALSPTGNKGFCLMCVTAGAWQVTGLTTV